MESNEIIIVGNTSDDPFAIDVAFAMGQVDDIADIVSLKTYANSEFCPRFISDLADFSNIGDSLKGKKVVIVSTSNRVYSRQSLAIRNMIISRAAKENGAQEVILVEPDLFYSAQDRGPHHHLGKTLAPRSEKDLKKFDGQPYTAKLYAELLKISGVDRVLTVHNHSYAVQSMFSEVFEGKFHHLLPYEIYLDYLRNSNIVQYTDDGDGLALCAPDQGAREFVEEMFSRLNLPKAKCLLLSKERSGERDVEISLFEGSGASFDDVAGHDIVLFDDMVRTGSTLVKTCQFLKKVKPGRLNFIVTHFYASDEGRHKMADTAIDEILTLNTLPTILNRDEQGRLRHKLVVLKIEWWLARELKKILNLSAPTKTGLYQIDMSSKNPRFIRKISSNDELRELHNRKQG